MSIIENYWSGSKADNVSLNSNKKAEDANSKAEASERPQMAEMPNIPMGRDLVKTPDREDAADKNEVDSYSYNNMLFGIAELLVCRNQDELATVRDMIKKHPETIEMLRKPKDSNGEDLFNLLSVCQILIQCKDVLKEQPEKVQAILDNPEEIKMLEQMSPKHRGLGFRTTLIYPLKSTIETNPEVFK